MKKDATKQPTTVDPKAPYYDAGGIEVIDFLRAKLTPEQFIGYCLGCQMAYLGRFNFKGDGKRDIEKAGVYNTLLQKALTD